MMRWGVWETRACDGLVAHDPEDLLVSAALVAILDRQGWPGTGKSGEPTADRGRLAAVPGQDGRENAPAVGGRGVGLGGSLPVACALGWGGRPPSRTELTRPSLPSRSDS
jgi:hypothetical protein